MDVNASLVQQSQLVDSQKKDHRRAYDELQAATPRTVFGVVIGGVDVARLRAAIGRAREVGLSDDAVAVAEEALRKAEGGGE